MADANIIFTGANIHLRSGAGSTSAPPNGLSNLIIGYDEMPGSTETSRTGSHNPWATVSGGNGNTASNEWDWYGGTLKGQ